MESNPQLELAYDFLEYTGVNVFLTGKAGTGKTTFLRELKRRSPKRMIVVAPTGVAAINAGDDSFLFPITIRTLCAGSNGGRGTRG